jgi:hypothetical protein
MEVEITQTLKPLRLLFLIVPYNKPSFLKAMQLCSAYFGGKYFPIIPFYQKFSFKFSVQQGVYGKKIGGYYNQIIENYSVDFVVYDDKLDIEKIKPFITGKDLIPLSILENSLCSAEPKYGFALHQIIPRLRKQEYKYVRTDHRQLLFTTTDEKALLWKALFGDTNPTYRQYLRENVLLKSEDYTDIDDDNGMEYLHDGYQNMLDIGCYEINKSGYDRDMVFWVEEDDLLSVNNFWNLRALGANIMAVPYKQLNNDHIRQRLRILLAKYQGDRLWHLMILQADRGNNESSKAFSDLIGQLNGNNHQGVAYYWWMLRYWEDEIYKRADHLAASTLWISSKKTTIETEDYISLPTLKPAFMYDYYHAHIDPVYTNTLSIRIRSALTDFGEVFPKFNDKEVGRLLRTMNKAGISSTGINFYPHLHDTFIGFTLPKSDELLAKLFDEKNLKIKPSSAGKLTREVLKNLGTVNGINIFNNRVMVDLLLKFRDGHTVLKKALFDYLQKHQTTLRPRYTSRDRVDLLVTRKFIRLGVTVDCSYCNRGSFYLVNELDYQMKCKVCENIFPLPSSNPDAINWSYQGAGAFALNNAAEGSISVLLTMRFFKTATLVVRDNTTILGTTILEGKAEKMEIDITLFQENDWSASRYPDLIFGECKTDNDFELKDVERMDDLGKLFPGSILLFATLKKQLNREEKRLIKKLANSRRVGNQFRPVNPILVLTANELLPDNVYEAIKNLEKNKIQHYHNEDSLGHLCELSNLEYLGLKPYRQVVEARYQKKFVKREVKIQKLKESGGDGAGN